MLREFFISLRLFILLFVVTGLLYPLFMLGVGEKLFPHQARGSLVESKGKIIGSELIGQTFSQDIYFHGRPSAAGNGYDANNSSGSNLGPSSGDLAKAVGARVNDLKKAGVVGPFPVDIVTASASGLDPDISPAAARMQAARVATARHLDTAKVDALILENSSSRTLDILGEPRVNVLALNRALDRLAPP